MSIKDAEILIDISIDDEEYFSQPEVSIIEVCKYVGITIPRFCYHELLSVAGNCRMCLVEIENVDKPVAACVTEVSDGISVYVNSPFAKKARENVVEFILLNHPLDCPICDQAGECDLQDQTKEFGAKLSRFFFEKKSVEDKYCGPLIKTIMTRCITCTRCVRFCDEIAGASHLGTLNRGEKTEISAYIDKVFRSEISANVIDLCPVGALNSKPIANEARPWELRMSESIDITDSLGANVYVEHKETSIVRITPKTNKEINRGLISDKARFYFDALRHNRLIDIFAIDKNKLLKKSSWKSFFHQLSPILRDKKTQLNIVVDGDADLKTLLFLKLFSNTLQNKIQLNTFENKYFKHTNISDFSPVHNIEQETEGIFFFGSNPKVENPVLNTKIKETFNNSATHIHTNGLTAIEYNSEKKDINTNLFLTFNLLTGKSKEAVNSLAANKNPLFIYGQNFADYVEDFNFISVAKNKIFSSAKLTLISLQSNLEAIRNLNIPQFVRNKSNKDKQVIFSNITLKTLVVKYTNKFRATFSISTHPSSYLIKKSDFLIPTTAVLESENILLNMEHRPQKINTICFSFTHLYHTSHIFSAIFTNNSLLKKDSWFNIFIECLYSKELITFCEIFSDLRDRTHRWAEHEIKLLFFYYKSKTIFKVMPLFQKSKNFYQNSILTQNSKIMELCANEKKTYFENHVAVN